MFWLKFQNIASFWLTILQIVKISRDYPSVRRWVHFCRLVVACTGSAVLKLAALGEKRPFSLTHGCDVKR